MMQRMTAAVAACCLLLLSSCEKPVGEALSVEFRFKKETVSSKAGQVFVSVKCSGTWTLSLTSDAGSVDWATLSKTSGTGDMNNVIMTYQANSGETNRTLKVVLDNGTEWVGAVLTQTCPAEDAPAGDEPGTGESGSGTSGSDVISKTGWMELPAMDNDALDYYSHSFSMNGKTYRNYTFGWSQKDYTAVWVAYPLCRMYTNKNVERSDDWDYDPLLGKNLSPAPFDGYAGSYTRGHQLPSADRLCCYEANAQTFYGTNMTPQLYDHNGGIWKELESKIRTIANNSDTTYVVTGVMIKNPKGYTTDSTLDKEKKTRPQSELKKLPVPSHYFKAILRYSKSSTLGQWNAAAFYLEHKGYSESIGKQHSMSIDELEEITGIDFFVNLPAKIGEGAAAQLEASDPADSQMWW